MNFEQLEACVEPDELLVVVGPTASGKSELAMRLAEQCNGEIVSVDSVQIYRHFDLGSGKPTAAEQARVRHHLVDIADPMDHFDAAMFSERADDAIADIRKRGRRPIVCGGTFLWVKALVWGLAGTPPKDEAVRTRHQALVDAHGRGALHQALAQVDPKSAERLAPNDFVRVSRALEVFELTGKTQTAWHQAHQFQQQRHRARLVGVHREREQLDARIEARVARWLEQGWVEEVRSLTKRGYGDARAMDAVGYRQVHASLAGELRSDELHQAIVRATRTYARRQRTWLRDQAVTWLSAHDDS